MDRDIASNKDGIVAGKKDSLFASDYGKAVAKDGFVVGKKDSFTASDYGKAVAKDGFVVGKKDSLIAGDYGKAVIKDGCVTGNKDSKAAIKKSVADKIIAATCSQAMRAALLREDTCLSDFDLLALAYRCAPDFRTRLQLLQLVEIKADGSGIGQITRSLASDQAARCIAYERAKLERFSLFEKDCVFEAEISSADLCSTKPSTVKAAAPACRLLTKTLDEALKAVEDYFHSHGININESTRFSITKRRLFGNFEGVFGGGSSGKNGILASKDTASKDTADKDSFSDFEGVANYKGNFILTSVSHKRLCNNTLIASDMACFDRDCKDCDNKPCLLHYAPKLPNPFSHFDLVYYTDRAGKRHFCIVLDIKTVQSDECAYLVPLCAAHKSFSDKDEFLRFLESVHIQIEFPLLEFADTKTLSPENKKTLTVLKKNYTLFCR